MTNKAEPERQRWDGHLHFIIAMLSFCVGLGNVWRFPYLIQKWGGGSFLFPFIIMMITVGAPALLVESMLGQMLQSGPLDVWLKLHPVLGGIGVTSMFSAYVIGIYYIIIVAWSLFYRVVVKLSKI